MPLACTFASVLIVFQLAQGTAPLFSLCCFLFIIVATAAFNLAGGFTQTSGAYVFFYSMLAVIVALVVKGILWEPADSNLVAPERTIVVFLLGICTMYGAVFISRKLTLRKALLADFVTDKNMQDATTGCLITGIFVQNIVTLIPGVPVGLVSVLLQINRFFPLTIILGTIYQIKKSRGTSSINLPVLIAGGYMFFLGLLGFSKEAMFTPLFCWLVAAASQNYRLSRSQVVGIVLTLGFMVTYLVPYAQVGRDYEVGPGETHLDTTIYLLSHLNEVRRQYHEVQEFSGANSELRGYFTHQVGFFERLQMVSVDDPLIEVTETKGPYGLLPIWRAFENLVPHVFWPNKPPTISGNDYAHELGVLISEEDTTTGISFTPSGEAYHLARWFGILFVAPAIWIMLFTFFNSLCGDTRVTPWGMLLIVYYAHIAPEAGLGGAIYALGYVGFAVVVATLSATYVMPILATLFKGPGRRRIRQQAPVRSLPRRPAAPSATLGVQ